MIFETNKRASGVAKTHKVQSVSECALISAMDSASVAFNYNPRNNTCEIIDTQNVSVLDDAEWDVYAITGMFFFIVLFT